MSDEGRKVLITGGAGFIGSHQTLACLEAGFTVCVVDDLSNATPGVVPRIAEVAGRPFSFHRIDVRDTEALAAVVDQFQPDAVIHFAGRKHVGESTAHPGLYYDTNLGGLLSLVRACERVGVRRVVFSSSGSVYGETDELPIVESHPHRPSNPYSATKSMGERILSDLAVADPGWRSVALRYFNPAGAHPSGLIGEWCLGPPSNLLPRLIEAAYGDERAVTIHGTDFATSDGTGVRDYVHVVDVAEAHLRALELLLDGDHRGFEALNVGRGSGVSVLELVKAVEAASGRSLEVHIGPRRPGDVSALYGDTTAAGHRLGMVDYLDLETICGDAWRFKLNNPDGYPD